MTTKNHSPSLPVRLDVENEWVWVGERQLRLTPKAFAVLRYLVERSGRLVGKEELLRAVWADTVVSEWVLTTCLREIRKALRDEAKAPRFIETVHRRGYRFIAPLTTSQPVPSSKFQVPSQSSKLAPNTQHPISTLVGREAELKQLQGWLERALSGERQVVFVTGEAGIGKTILVETFLAQARTEKNLWLGQGQCIEHFGAGEAYLPVLEVLGQLCRQPGHERLIELLRRYAPTWLVQLPWLLSPLEQEGLQRQVLGAARERMLREMAELVQELTIETPLIIVLEDLQWSDYSTLDLLSFLARRREAARLLFIGTYRPVDVLLRDHPLRGVKQDLLLHEQGEELPLELLTEKAVAEYLTRRLGREVVYEPPLADLARRIHHRTDGNPLFMVTVVDYLVGQGVLVQDWAHDRAPIPVEQQGLKEKMEAITVGVPRSVRQMIEVQLEGLNPEEQRVLEAGSVVGVEFSAPTVAAALQEGTVRVEECCEGLTRRGQFLRPTGVGEWPDGTVTASYSFLHALYQETLYERVTATRRVELYRRIGERQEAAYGDRAGEIAAALAMQFEEGHEYGRAVQYLQRAAQNALRRSAHREAILHLTKALNLLKALPDTPERDQQELSLQLALGPALTVTKGFAAPEVGAAYNRARELCRLVGETPQIFPALVGLWSFYLLRVELQTARELGEQILSLAQKTQDSSLLLEAHRVLGASSYWLGEFALARSHLEQGIALYDPQQHRSHRFLYWDDPGMACLSYAALTLWHLGYPDQALRRSREALALAQDLSYPFSQTFVMSLAAICHQYRREERITQEQAEGAISLSTEHGFPLWRAMSTILRGWALANQGQGEAEIAQIRQGLVDWQATGIELARPYFLALLAETFGKAGRTEEGLAALAEALTVVHTMKGSCDEAELYRLKGELSLQLRQVKTSQGKSEDTNTQHPTPSTHAEAEAEACFHQAIEIARKQSAKSLELRATLSLVQLWQQQGKGEEARQMLAEIYSWFTEGFDTADLQEAKALLTAWESQETERQKGGKGARCEPASQAIRKGVQTKRHK